jgi:hypothetical protein
MRFISYTIYQFLEKMDKFDLNFMSTDMTLNENLPDNFHCRPHGIKAQRHLFSSFRVTTCGQMWSPLYMLT